MRQWDEDYQEEWKGGDDSDPKVIVWIAIALIILLALGVTFL